jgi:predicted flap endonuclease-1-like 5' DNA nuclease
MFYLAWQTLFWLILAFLFGLFIGWLIWSRRSDVEASELRLQIRDLKDDLKMCNDDLELYKKELEEACKDESVPPLPSSIPTARPEEADDLKEILGVGPILEGKLKAFGIYTFKQVAAFTPNVIKELGATFGSFSGRIVRERWVEQAKELHEKKYGEKL